MGAYGLRPVVEVQFADYVYPAYDQIVSEAARLRYRSAGDFTSPLTIRMGWHINTGPESMRIRPWVRRCRRRRCGRSVTR